MADTYSIPFFEASAKQNIGVSEMFQKLAEDVMKTPGLVDQVNNGSKPAVPIVNPSDPQLPAKKGSSCC